MTPHCSLFSTPRLPDHSSRGGDADGGSDQGRKGQKLYWLGRQNTRRTISTVALASCILISYSWKKADLDDDFAIEMLEGETRAPCTEKVPAILGTS